MHKTVAVSPHCGHQRKNKVLGHRCFNEMLNTVTGNIKEEVKTFRSRVSRLRLGKYRLQTVTSKKSVCLWWVATFFDVTVCSRYLPKQSRETRDRKVLTSSLMLPVTVLSISLKQRCSSTLSVRWCPQCGRTATVLCTRYQTRRGAHRWKADAVSFPAHCSKHQSVECARRKRRLNALAD